MDIEQQAKPKKERSPSFPFISLRKCIERVQSLYENHRREPARLASVASSWGYSPKSSGVLQTAAALKQFGLIDDLGSGDDRKIVLTRLGHTILADSRPGMREAALKDAARSSTLIAEYLPRWVPNRPSDAHCISELHLDRGFTEDAARSFLRVFDETVSYAQLTDEVSNGPDLIEDTQPEDKFEKSPQSNGGSFFRNIVAIANAPKPLRDRLQVSFNSQTLAVTATLETESEADKLIDTVRAMKNLLPTEKPSKDDPATDSGEV